MSLFSLNEIYNEYIAFFITVRPHGLLGNCTPEEFDEDGLIKAKKTVKTDGLLSI